MAAQVETFVKPSDESMSLVNEFLSENDISAETISPAGDWLQFSISVSKANDLFDADFSVFTHEETGQEAVRTLSYSIPANLVGHPDLVHPTITCVLFASFGFYIVIGIFPKLPQSLLWTSCRASTALRIRSHVK